MTRPFTELRDEMRRVARGEIVAPERLTQPPQSAPDLVGALTPANRRLMELIAAHRPASVSALAELAGRSQANVSRSLQDLARVGAVGLIRDGGAVRPVLRIAEITVSLTGNSYSVVPNGPDEDPA